MTATWPERALRWVLAAGLVLVLAANLPGHLSLDSVNALYEARTGTQITWAPIAYAWVVGLFDDMLAGPSLYVVASSALLFFSLMLLPGLRPKISWAAPLVAAAAIATPQVLIYQGIVWRDVLFANLSIAGFVFLARAGLAWDARRPWPSLLAALLLLALAASIRQNGLVMSLAAALTVGWYARGNGGLRSAGLWAVGWVLATALAMVGIDAAAQPESQAPNLRPNAGVRILEHYDVVGIAARDPNLKLDLVSKSDPERGRILRERAQRLYSVERVDTLDPDPEFRRSLWRTPDAVMAAQWRQAILQDPVVYLHHRASVFRQVLATPKLAACLPVQVGVGGAPAMTAELGIAQGQDQADMALARYAAAFYPTPVYSHLTWAAVALGLFAVFAWRRSPADVAMAGLMGGALAFAASFFPISIACDYRYLYAVDLAAMAGLIYLAVDPRLSRR